MNNEAITNEPDGNQGRFWYLIDAAVTGALTNGETQELEALLKADHQSRQMFLEYARLNYELAFQHQAQDAVEGVRGQGLGGRAQGAGIRGRKVVTRRVLRSVLALALSLLVLAGVASFAIWGRSGHQQPSLVQAPGASIATLVRDSGAQWDPAFAPAGRELTAAKRLKLKRGTAEIAFTSQARVILEGPADFTVGHAESKSEIRNPKSEIFNSCFLASGALTARVPEVAHGFTVHTPNGQATDLGTEFGVFVKSEVGSRKSEFEKPTSDLGPPTSTEVHVFQGRVDVAGGNNLTPSAPENQKSEILTAGQAVIIANSGLDRLPAADPFRFCAEAFNGGSRQVVATDDFESMDLGASGHVLGDWRVDYVNNRDQQIIAIDPTISSPPRGQSEGESGSVGNPAVLPPVGRRAMEITSSFKMLGKQGRHLHPLLTRMVDGQQLPARCKLLVECDILPRTKAVEPSISVNDDYPLRLAPGIAMSREADPAAPPIEWRTDQWYRLRIIWEMENRTPRGATVQRLQWRGSEGWVRDVSVQLPAPPKLVTGPMAQVRFGFPAPIVGKAGGTFWLDNIRIEVLGEK